MTAAINYNYEKNVIKKNYKTKTHKLETNLKSKKSAEVLFQRVGAKVYAITVLAGEPYWSEVPLLK